MQSIITKFHGPTNTRGARISATTSAGRVTEGYDHSLSAEANHLAVAKALIAKLGWSGRWVVGGSLDLSGYVLVCDTGALSVEV